MCALNALFLESAAPRQADTTPQTTAAETRVCAAVLAARASLRDGRRSA
ncbi:hypothetical protein [Actinotalea fermentans]|uniref:Uncharacterized protein n=1 Tax=Actinotalea fermentans TaxID=43671 RepID=A0A511Z136_9CELL|nr:hypothetical protein [Actinotalea fermentans]GEN81177.1 hypothetical protein AFE02nite_29110 [Actinotalea fermentans]